MTVTGECLRSSSALSAAVSYRVKTTRVLVVDDERAARQLLALIFAPPAFRCISAADGQEALVALQREEFDVIITDLRMPGIDGMALITEARHRYRHVAFLVMTGVDDVEVGVSAMRSGADDYLVKPVTEAAVMASVERALHKHALEIELEHYRLHLESMIAERTAELRDTLGRLERSYLSTLESLGAAIDLRDKDTGGHSRRVCRYSIEMAKRLSLTGEQMKSLGAGAYLHDIGKLGVPDAILLKPGSLTPEEREVMQRHVEIGFDLVKGIPFLAGAAEIVLTHHERFDGKGYPKGIRGEQIPLGGRIFSVADAFDAITSDRPYRRASSIEAGRAAIRSESGRQFDPRIVEAFLSVPVDMWSTMATDQCETSSALDGLGRIPAS